MSVKTEVTKRAYDNKFVLWGYIVDPTYDPKEFGETNIPYIPQRWVMLGVYDDARTAYAKQKEYQNKMAPQQIAASA